MVWYEVTVMLARADAIAPRIPSEITRRQPRIPHLLALADRFKHRIHLAALALGGDDAEHLPHVREALEIFTPLAALVHAPDDAPVAQRPQAHAGVPARDV